MAQSLRRFLPLLAVYATIVAATQYAYFGDTTGYVHNVLLYDQNPQLGAKDFWDFGHLLWRPSAWVLYKAVGGAFPYAQSGENNLTITALFIAMSTASTMVTVLLFRSLAARFLTSPWVAAFVAIAFLCFHAILNYMQTGVSYLPGLMGMTLSLWSMLRATEDEKRALRYALLAGAGAAWALLFWFPYAIAFPGLLAAAILWPAVPNNAPGMAPRLRLAAVAFGFALLLVIGVCVLPVIQLHLYSFHAVKRWIGESSHGWAQNRRALRMLTGLPRSFVWMGDEGLLLKRYFFHDPYVRVTLVDVAREFWGVLAFYVFVACLLWILALRGEGRRLLLLLGIAGVPLLLFAVFVFEPGSIERYLPLYPFLCLAVAYALSRTRECRWAVAGILAFLCLAMFLNVKAMWRPSLLAAREPSLARARSLVDQVDPNGLIALLSLRDDLYMLPGAHPFDAEFRHAVLPVYNVIEPGNQRAAVWKQQFAQLAAASLQKGSKVWVSKRLLAVRPLPEWGWTEGDDPRLAWRDVRPFFARFHYSADIGGPDGFLLLDPSPENMKLLAGAG